MRDRLRLIVIVSYYADIEREAADTGPVVDNLITASISFTNTTID